MLYSPLFLTLLALLIFVKSKFLPGFIPFLHEELSPFYREWILLFFYLKFLDNQFFKRYFHWASKSELTHFFFKYFKDTTLCLLAFRFSNKKPTIMWGFFYLTKISFLLSVALISLSLITMMFQIFCLLGVFCLF